MARSARDFTEDAEMMDELPNPELDVRPKPVFNSTPHCHPKCKWDCTSGAQDCTRNCKHVCKAPVCRTDCGKPDLSKCVRHCEDPQCAVVCPESPEPCAAGDCPQCETVCGQPNCTMDCGHGQGLHCQTVCATPSCAFECHAEACPEPNCKLVCEQPAQEGCLNKKNDVNLHMIYAGHGPLMDAVTAQYAGREVAWQGLAKPIGPLEGPIMPEPVLPMAGGEPPPAVSPGLVPGCPGCMPAAPAPCSPICQGCEGGAPAPCGVPPAELNYNVEHAPIPYWLTTTPTPAPLKEDVITPGGKMVEAGKQLLGELGVPR